ncbi:hypothetical protein [Alkalilimnicola sp. S0819]|uniref:hypothetical protein n=1 Tax=Alkalilimnicola sp. S0819 TaxID=2613922 RepID=UPI00126149A4|nr:hypothetical protein [Alkalilimnicola sp. S0819]KAB7624318.1 hypothetical protein F3N43_05785 [Alkalilimnicola sp. S0819]MPQ16142.1 hypothetical protein [Alkalilimnicola sp. S0819]
MAEMRAAVIMELVDRITKPVRRIRATVRQFAERSGFARLGRDVRRVGERFQVVRSEAGRLARRIGIVGAAAGAAGAALFGMTNHVARAGDNIAKTARKLGLGVEELQQYRYAAERSGVAQQTFDMALQRFTRRAAEAAAGTGEARDALRYLGIDLQDANGKMRPSGKLLQDVSDRMAEIEDPALRVRLAFKLFDSEGVNMVNMLGEGSAAMREMMAEKRRLGQLSEEGAERSEDYTDAMSKFMAALGGVRDAVVTKIMPAMTRWLTQTAELIAANREVITQRLINGIKSFWEKLKAVGAAISWLVDLVGGWRVALGIVAALIGAKLIASVGSLVVAMFTLGKGFIGAAIATKGFGLALLATPVGWIIAAVAAIAAAVYLIVKHWEPISAWFSRLWDAIGGTVYFALERIKGFFSGIWGAITGALQSGLDRVKGLFKDGILVGLSKILLAFSPVNLIMKPLNALFKAVMGYDLSTAGKKLIGSFGNGISERFLAVRQWLTGKIRALIDWMPDWVKDKLGLQGGGGAMPLGEPLRAGGNSPVRSAGQVNANVGGVLRIEFDDQGRPRVGAARAEGGMELDVDAGLMGASL